MANQFYNHGGYPATQAQGSSAAMRAELDAIAAGFDKMPTLTGNAGQIVIVNASATGLTTTTAGAGFSDAFFRLSDDIDPTKQAMFQCASISPSQTRVFTFPDANTTLVGTDAVQTLTNKTLNGTVAGTPTFSGAVAFGSTTLHTGIATFSNQIVANNFATITAAGTQLVLRSGAAGASAAVNIGRTATEGYWAVSNAPNSFAIGDVAGDMVLRSEQRLWLGVGAQGHIRMDNSLGIRTLMGLLAAGELISPAVSGVNIGLSGGQPSQSYYYTGGGADSKHWNVYADATQLNHRIINDAGNAQALWLTVARTGMVVSRVHFPGSTTGNSRMLIGDYSGSLICRTTVAASMAANGADGLAVVKSDDTLAIQLLLTGTSYSYAGVGANQGWLYTRGAMDLNIGPDGAGSVALISNGARQVIVAAAGMGIGVAPTCKLDVFGNFINVRDASFSGYFGRASDLVLGGTGAQLGVRSNSQDILFTTVTAGTEFMRLDTAGRLSGKTWHNNASGFAGTTQQYIGSGTYTPTFGVFTNISAASAVGAWRYLRVGNVVTVSGTMSVTISAGGTQGLRISLAIASVANLLGGAGSLRGATGTTIGIFGNGNSAECTLYSAAAGTFQADVTFTYEVQ